MGANYSELAEVTVGKPILAAIIQGNTYGL
jgi:hypothetical protein